MKNNIILNAFAVKMLLGFALSVSTLTGCNTETKSDVKATVGTTTTDSVSTGAAADAAVENKVDLQPKGPKPEWAPELEPEMGVVLEKLASYNAKPIPELTAMEARNQPSPTTAVMDVMKEHNISMPIAKVDTMGQKIPIAGGKSIHARIYTPKEGAGPFPVIVYFHGGGWVIADLDTYDASAKGLAEQTGAVVVSVAYRQAPENKFPAAHEDAYAAYEWVIKNAGTIKGDPKRVAVAGESAGGNLAANVSIMARDKKAQMPVHQLLVYPVANNDMNSESYKQYANAKPLDKPMMEWFVKQALPKPSMSSDPRISLVKANLKGLPTTTIIGAQLDPLQTEGKLLADKLKDAGVEVNYKLYDGVTHEFFGMAIVVPEAKEAQAYAVDDLKKAFGL